MKILEKLKNLLNKVEDSFMTNHSCVSCTKEIVDGSRFSLCADCQNKLDKIQGNVCIKCGERLFGETIRVCDYCKEREYDFASNRSCFYYDDVSAKIVKNLKYDNKRYIAKSVAEMMLARKEFFNDVDLITFVPISKSRKNERGFNQAEEIAKHIAKALDINVIGLLVKSKGGKHQADLNMKQRLTNPIGTFALKEDCKQFVKDKRILIIDDVFTTGSTLSECARVLKQAKPKLIKTVTFAKTKFNSI